MCSNSVSYTVVGIIIRQGDVSIAIPLVGRAFRLDVVATHAPTPHRRGALSTTCRCSLGPNRAGRHCATWSVDPFLLGIILGKEGDATAIRIQTVKNRSRITGASLGAQLVEKLLQILRVLEVQFDASSTIAPWP